MPAASTRLTIGGLVKLLLTTDREPLTLQPTLEELILVHYGLRSNGAWNIDSSTIIPVLDRTEAITWGRSNGAVIEWESSICRAAEQLAAKKSIAAQTAVTAAVVADKMLL
jgi:hypothetical protein